MPAHSRRRDRSDLAGTRPQAGLQPTRSAVANSLRSDRASDGRPGPEPQAQDPGLLKKGNDNVGSIEPDDSLLQPLGDRIC